MQTQTHVQVSSKESSSMESVCGVVTLVQAAGCRSHTEIDRKSENSVSQKQRPPDTTNQEQEGSDRNIRARAKNTLSKLPAFDTERCVCKTSSEVRRVRLSRNRKNDLLAQKMTFRLRFVYNRGRIHTDTHTHTHTHCFRSRTQCRITKPGR